MCGFVDKDLNLSVSYLMYKVLIRFHIEVGIDFLELISCNVDIKFLKNLLYIVKIFFLNRNPTKSYFANQQRRLRI